MSAKSDAVSALKLAAGTLHLVYGSNSFRKELDLRLFKKQHWPVKNQSNYLLLIDSSRYHFAKCHHIHNLPFFSQLSRENLRQDKWYGPTGWISHRLAFFIDRVPMTKWGTFNSPRQGEDKFRWTTSSSICPLWVNFWYNGWRLWIYSHEFLCLHARWGGVLHCSNVGGLSCCRPIHIDQIGLWFKFSVC